MSIDLARLLIDVAFAVLIWAVQLVIYPGFKFYNSKNLLKWHISYTKRITFIVLPLMFSQLILGILHLWKIQNEYTIVSLILIIILWLQTFIIFVPLHRSIDNQKPIENVSGRLVSKNWIRTFLWNLLFIISLANYLSLNS